MQFCWQIIYIHQCLQASSEYTINLDFAYFWFNSGFRSIQDFVRFGVCPIRDFVHSGFWPIKDFVHSEFCPIRDFAKFGILSVNHVVVHYQFSKVS